LSDVSHSDISNQNPGQVEEAWHNAQTIHAQGFVGIQVNQLDPHGHIEIIRFDTPRPENDNTPKEQHAEEKRFRAAIHKVMGQGLVGGAILL
jgi:hypothetical protein